MEELFELDTRREISYLQATIYYFCLSYKHNSPLLEKSILSMNENEEIDNLQIKVLKYVALRLKTKNCVKNNTKPVKNSQLSSWSLPTGEIFQAHGQNRLEANPPIGDFRSQLFVSLPVANATSHSWAIELNTRREIPYLFVPMYYSLFTLILGEIVSLGMLIYAEVLDLTSTVSSKIICLYIHS